MTLTETDLLAMPMKYWDLFETVPDGDVLKAAAEMERGRYRQIAWADLPPSAQNSITRVARRTGRDHPPTFVAVASANQGFAKITSGWPS